MRPRIAKILEVGPHPPPLAGWSIRIRFVQDRLKASGHVCEALNIGKRRRIPSNEYVTVNGVRRPRRSGLLPRSRCGSPAGTDALAPKNEANQIEIRAAGCS